MRASVRRLGYLLERKKIPRGDSCGTVKMGIVFITVKWCGGHVIKVCRILLDLLEGTIPRTSRRSGCRRGLERLSGGKKEPSLTDQVKEGSRWGRKEELYNDESDAFGF